MARSAKRYSRNLRRTAACLALVSITATAQAPGDVRIALVIGNAAYGGAAALTNPANDAAAMSAALKTLGFTVVEIKDGSRAQMTEAIASVRDSLRGKQAVGMLYYAGHGVQVDWRNYMVPVDARMTTAADVSAQALDVNAVLAAFTAAGNRMNIVVLDACRDNPFAGTGSGKGLAQVDAPPGTFLAYATAPGNVAEDGAGTNGLYTGYLVQELARPAARIEDVFKRVRLQVRQQSKGRQVPWESTSLEQDFYFNDPANPIKAGSAEKPAAEPRAQELARAAPPVQVQPPAPKKEDADLAFAREKADWDRIAASRNPDDFYEFLKKYPSGNISELATAKLERIAEAKIVQVANKDGVVQVPARDRFRLGDRYSFQIRDDYTKITQQHSALVRAVTEGTVDFGNALLTREGGTIRNSFIANLDPPRLDLPAGDYAVGKSWTYRTLQTNLNGMKVDVRGEVVIAALEDVTVPAGTFKAYRLVHTNFQSNGAHVKLVSWMRPEWGFPLKLVREIRPRSGAPTLDTWEMTAVPRRAG
jgi:uncharacterized caspase-like protein